MTNWDIAEGITEELRRADTWASHHMYTVEDWKHEIAEGDTRLGYHEWLTCRIGNALDDGETNEFEVTNPVAYEQAQAAYDGPGVSKTRFLPTDDEVPS